MTNKTIITTLAICLIAISALSANANQWGRGEYCQPGQGGPGYSENGNSDNEWRGNRREHRGEMMTELLGLSEEQQEQIEAIRTEERAAHEAQRERVREYQDQIRELSKAGTFDENSIRAIAEEKAAIQVEMAVSKAQMHSKISAIMTPEQQELFAKMSSLRHNKHGKHRQARGGMATQQ